MQSFEEEAEEFRQQRAMDNEDNKKKMQEYLLCIKQQIFVD